MSLPLLTDEERAALLAVARQAVMRRVTGIDEIAGGAAVERPGCAFVTVRCDGQLRGCLGTTDATRPLGEVVARCAAAAACEDPRFAPLALDELPRVDIEISVLGPVERVTDPSTIEIGRHGLLVGEGGRQGLLLPQVAPEHGWDRETFLRHACLKAGLEPDGWRSAAVYRFEADVFGGELMPSPVP